MTADQPIDVQRFIDARGLSLVQVLLLVLCFLVVAVDGFDTIAIGFIAPAIREATVPPVDSLDLPHLRAAMAAVARLNPYHFARQLKATTGLRPHQYVILRRVERAKQLLQARTDLSLAEVALHAGFSDQSQFSHHFKRFVAVTPGQFRTPSRIA